MAKGNRRKPEPAGANLYAKNLLHWRWTGAAEKNLKAGPISIVFSESHLLKHNTGYKSEHTLACGQVILILRLPLAIISEKCR